MYPSLFNTLSACGYVAACLSRNLQRVITILSHIATHWHFLHRYSYSISCGLPHARVSETASSGLGLCIGLINIRRMMLDKPALDRVLGTGLLRVDGRIDTAHLECVKKEAALSLDDPYMHFITSQDYGHVFDLERWMTAQ